MAIFFIVYLLSVKNNTPGFQDAIYQLKIAIN